MMALFTILKSLTWHSMKVPSADVDFMGVAVTRITLYPANLGVASHK